MRPDVASSVSGTEELSLCDWRMGLSGGIDPPSALAIALHKRYFCANESEGSIEDGKYPVLCFRYGYSFLYGV